MADSYLFVAEASDSMHSRGGLHTLFSMVLGGLVAATPHMVAASVMALARLLYEFAGPLEYMVDDLLPAVLALLRTKSREVVKAVLGFVKVQLSLCLVNSHNVVLLLCKAAVVLRNFSDAVLLLCNTAIV